VSALLYVLGFTALLFGVQRHPQLRDRFPVGKHLLLPLRESRPRMKTLLFHRALHQQMKQNLSAQDYKEMRRKVTLSVARQVLQDTEARSGNIPLVFSSIIEYIKANWVDILKVVIMIISMVAQENDE
jgi:hypothetical protein